MHKTWSSQVNKNFNVAAFNYNESASIQKSTALKLAKYVLIIQLNMDYGLTLVLALDYSLNH